MGTDEIVINREQRDTPLALRCADVPADVEKGPGGGGSLDFEKQPHAK
jgi:hypothetical protein